MRKEYRELKKIVKTEGGEVSKVVKHDRMDKVMITFGGVEVQYNFSASKHCNFEKIVRSQIRSLKKNIA